MRLVTTFISALAVALPALAHAQAVDPNGAIHALTGPHRHHHHRRHHVTIPRYVHHRHHFGIALPPGTSRPGPSHNFIPTR